MKLYKDKIQHVVVCFIGTLILNAAFNPFIAALCFFTLFTLGKEYVYDLRMGRGQFDYLDIAANAIGCTIALVLSVVWRVLF